VDPADQPAEVDGVLYVVHTVVSRRVPHHPGVGDVVERKKDASQQLEHDEDEDHPAEAVVEGVREVRDPLIEGFVNRLCERIALVQPIHHRQLNLARVRDRQLFL